MKRRTKKVWCILILIPMMINIFGLMPISVIFGSNGIFGLQLKDIKLMKSNWEEIIPKEELDLQESLLSWIGIQPVLFQDSGTGNYISISDDYYSGMATNDPPFRIFHNNPYIIDEKYMGQVVIDGKVLFLKKYVIEWQMLYVTMCNSFEYMDCPDHISKTIETCHMYELVHGGSCIKIGEVYLPGWFTRGGDVGGKTIKLPKYDIPDPDGYLDNLSTKILDGKVLTRLFISSETINEYFKKKLETNNGEYEFLNDTLVYISNLVIKNSEMGSVHNESNVKINILRKNYADEGGYREFVDEPELDETVKSYMLYSLAGNPTIFKGKYELNRKYKESCSVAGWYEGPPDLNIIQRGRRIAADPENHTPTTWTDTISNQQNITWRDRNFNLSFIRENGQIDSIIYESWIKMRPDLTLYQLHHTIHKETATCEYGLHILQEIDWNGIPKEPIVIPIPPHLIRGDRDTFTVNTINAYETNNVFIHQNIQAEFYIGALYNWTADCSDIDGWLDYYNEEEGDDVFNGIPEGNEESEITYDPGIVDAFMNAVEKDSITENIIYLIIIIVLVVVIIIAVVYIYFKRKQTPTW